MVMATLKTNLTKTKGNLSNPRVLSDIGLAILSQKGKYIYKNSYTMSEDIQTALLTRSEIEWLLGKRQLSKHYERKMRAVLNKKLRTWEQLE
jgi:hypothetical protein